LLAENNIGIFAISTYNTDYILTKTTDFQSALRVLEEAGYQILG
ncbi:MAG: ACT domain-containing protein, partial [Streptococcus gallolyticus]|nr:ACT domain-containing protein [Streptococcus gallolyticus]